MFKMNDSAASRPWRNKTLLTRTRTIHCALFPPSFGCFLSSSFDNKEIAASCFSPPPFSFDICSVCADKRECCYCSCTTGNIVHAPKQMSVRRSPRWQFTIFFSHLPRPAALRLARHFFQVSLSQDPRPCYNLFRLRAFFFVPCGFAPSSVPSRTPCHFFDDPELLLLRHCLRVCLFCFAC